MSDIKAAEAIASEPGPAETSPANDPAAKQTPAEVVASSEGGPATAPAVIDHATATNDPHKLENELGASKESKTPAKKDTEVAGRKEKGVLGLSFFKKLFGKKEKKTDPATTSSTPSAGANS